MNTLITWAKEALKSGHNTQAPGSKDWASTWWHRQYAVNLWKRLEQYERKNNPVERIQDVVL
jgi:hypothetical protein